METGKSKTKSEADCLSGEDHPYNALFFVISQGKWPGVSLGSL